MSFFRKRQASQTGPTAAVPQATSQPLMNQPRDVPGPSGALRLAQQSQALNNRVTPDDRLALLLPCCSSASPNFALIGLPSPGLLLPPIQHCNRMDHLAIPSVRQNSSALRPRTHGLPGNFSSLLRFWFRVPACHSQPHHPLLPFLATVTRFPRFALLLESCLSLEGW
jgi:hypothetical protein